MFKPPYRKKVLASYLPAERLEINKLYQKRDSMKRQLKTKYKKIFNSNYRHKNEREHEYDKMKFNVIEQLINQFRNDLREKYGFRRVKKI